MNTVILIGNIGADPTTISSRDDKSVVKFRLATSRPKYDKDGAIRDREGRVVQDTEWHTVICFNAVAKSVAKYSAKGQKIAVQGRIANNNWTDDKGTKHYAYEIVADTVQFLSQGRQQDDTGGQDDESYARSIDEGSNVRF